MAAAATCKRLAQLRTRSGIAMPITQFSSFEASKSFSSNSSLRSFSQLVKSNGQRLFLVDTLVLVRKLEGQGLPTKQAEAITDIITKLLNDSLGSLVSKAEMQRGHHFSSLLHENEKLRNDIEKMRSELRYEIDKFTAGQRLDLNLERGRIREELFDQNAETDNLSNKLDREVNALRAQLDAAKYDVIKYCIGTLVSISTVGLAVLRILM
nr:coiled-coil domain-containing protein 90B, mitochondrial isoform X2 [Arachis hypogaea]